MISKRIAMKSAKKSSFADLANYITSSQGITERVGEVRITNCQSDSVRWAVGEVLSTQQKNERATGDKTYHLLISFAPGEKPSAEVIRDVEDRLCAVMGYGEHQRISAVHHDTDAVHIHVAINKIHPQKLTMHEPYRDYKSRSEMCAQLEVEHGLQRVNHAGRKREGESNAVDMEHHAGVESLITWVRRECLEEAKAANSWAELHQVLRENGLQLKERGNGLVIADQGGTVIKASTVARDFSKGQLESRLGAYEARFTAPRGHGSSSANAPKKPGISRVGKRPPPNRKSTVKTLEDLETVRVDSGKRYEKAPIGYKTNTAELYAQYKSEQEQNRTVKATLLQQARLERDRAIELANQTSRLKRAAIKLMTDPGFMKRALYTSAFKTLQDSLSEARSGFQKSSQRINQQNQRLQWADWLQAKALEGNQDALKAMRARGKSVGLRGDAVSGQGAPVVTTAAPLQRDHITKEGTVIYRAGASAIRDDGDRLQLSREAKFDGIETALRLAVARYGETIRITGTDQFKEQVARAAAVRNLKIKFEDPALEARRQSLAQAIEKERQHVRRAERLTGYRSDPGLERGGASGAGAGKDGFDPAEHGGRAAGANAGGRAAGTELSGGSGAGRIGSGGLGGGRRQPVRRGGQGGKPGIAKVGSRPPPDAKNNLRSLSELSLVQHSEGGELLLPRDVPQNVDEQGKARVRDVRRDISSGGIATGGGALSGDQAAQKYIAEREGKRAKGFDIPKHKLYNSGDAGTATFAGVRQVEGQSMVLLAKDDDVLVMPVSAETAARMKRMKLGTAITTKASTIKRKGKSR